MTDVTPIETHYAGCRFRSRLEARWAVILDTKGLKWEYEPEGFETPCGRYLPDFRVELLPPSGLGVEAFHCWLEIKPEDYALDQVDMGRWFSVARATNTMLITACGLFGMTIVITPGHTYSHQGHPGFLTDDEVIAGKMARFEFGERG